MVLAAFAIRPPGLYEYDCASQSPEGPNLDTNGRRWEIQALCITVPADPKRLRLQQFSRLRSGL